MNTYNLILWTGGGYLSGISLSVSINIVYKGLYNKELSRPIIYGIIFVTTSICFLRGFTEKGLLENIYSILISKNLD
jgi:hypothetical protein